MSEARIKTRDLLLEYDKVIMPPKPRAAGLGSVYPWENLPISFFSQQLFQLAMNSGFEGTEADFKNKFGSYLQSKQIIYANYTDFPAIGEIDKFYFDLIEKILYYWDNEYIPVNAMLIADTVINGGEA
jgi:hypothetical protein